MNNKDIGLRVAGTLFGVVGLLHLLRLLTGFELIVAGHFIPLWLNGIGMAIAGSLAVWLFCLSCRGPQC